MSIFCASTSPHPAAAGIVDAFLQVPWKTSLKLDKVRWGAALIAGLLGLGGPANL